MSNVTLVNASRSARPFVWSYPGQNSLTPYSTKSTTIATPSLGKYKDSIYTVFQAFLTATATGAAATISIQGTEDAMTAFGVQVPLLLTNGNTTASIPTGSYTMTVLDANKQPTGTTLITSNTTTNLYTVPIDRTSALWSSPFVNVDQGIVAVTSGMTVEGAPGLAAGTTVASVANGGGSLTLSAAFTGTTGVYLVNIANPYWAATALGTITLSAASTLYAADGFTTSSSWKYVRANVSAISGTGAAVQVWMGA